MDKKDLKQIDDMFAKHVGILLEGFQHKADIVVEEHQLLNEKINRIQQVVTGLTGRVDRIELITLPIVLIPKATAMLPEVNRSGQ